MCAWWTGQPVYGSSPVSKYVRENFAYIKPLIDLLTNSAVTQADLTKLHAIAATAAQVDRNTSLATLGDITTQLNAGSGSYNIPLTFEPSVIIFIGGAGMAGSGVNLFGTFGLGFDDAVNHRCIYTWNDVPRNLMVADNAVGFSLILNKATGTDIIRSYVSAKNGAGFTITVTKSGPDTNYFAHYLAFP